MLRAVVFATLISLSLNLNCQNNNISGLIKDSDTNLPIPYAYIYIKGTSFGTISNQDGHYVFFLPKKPTRDSVVVSCVGYSTRAFSLQGINDSIFNVNLNTSPVLLQEITVVPVDIKAILEKAQDNISKNFPTAKYIALNVIPSEWYDAKCDTVLSVCGVKCMGEGGCFFEKMAGIFGGRK